MAGYEDAWNMQGGAIDGHAPMMWIEECQAQNTYPNPLGATTMWVEECPAQSTYPNPLGTTTMWIDECQAQSIYPDPVDTVPYAPPTIYMYPVEGGIQQVQVQEMSHLQQEMSQLQSAGAQMSEAQLAMTDPFQALQNMMAPCLVTQQTPEVAAPSSPSQRSSAVRIVNKKIAISAIPSQQETQASGESAGMKLLRFASQQQTQASGELAGQMLLRMVQRPQAQTPHWTDRYPASNTAARSQITGVDGTYKLRARSAEDMSSDGSTADTMDTVDRGTILAAGNIATDASKTAASAFFSKFGLGVTRTQTMPQLGSPELPTVGSKDHSLGTCKPCAFFFKEDGCQSGADCKFCHLCDSGEKKRRQRDKLALRRLAREEPMHSSQCAASIAYQ